MRLEVAGTQYEGFEEAHLSTMAVLPDYRRRGLAKAMLRHLLDVARKRAANRMTLEVREHNEAARHLYLKFGFKIDGFIPGYYGDTGENAYVMSRELGEEPEQAGLSPNS